MKKQVRKYMGAREAQHHFPDLVGQIHDEGEAVIIERAGKPMVAVVPLQMYERLGASNQKPYRALQFEGVQGPSLISHTLHELSVPSTKNVSWAEQLWDTEIL